MSPLHSFPLDPFQKKALAAAAQGRSILVSAPTGTGKTLIAEEIIADALNQGQGVVYTSPIKALSNQKFRDFSRLFPDQTGIVTGDVSINPNAPLLIQTTEIFRNRLLEHPEGYRHHHWLILDEFHFLDDADRGTVWEESLVLLPRHMRLAGLSATMPNLRDLASWLQGILGHPLEVISETHRVVPLHYCFQIRGQVVSELKRVHHIGYGPQSRHYLEENLRHHRRRHPQERPSIARALLDANRPQSLIEHLNRAQRLPCIYFTFSRKRCESLAGEIALTEGLLSAEQTQELEERFRTLARHYELESSAHFDTLLSLLQKGVAFHHAGLHPQMKEVIEQLVSLRLVPVIVTTETFALGINIPARAVVLDQLRKRYGEQFRTLRRRDFAQMAGRAGRRGFDSEGFVYARLTPEFIRYDEVTRLIREAPEPVRSRLDLSFAALLNLYEHHGESLLELYPRTLHHHQSRPQDRQRHQKLIQARLALLQELGYIRHQRLTPKGLFAKGIFGYELVMGELYEGGFLEELPVPQLAALLMAVVHEPRPGQEEGARPPSDLRQLVRTVTPVFQRLLRAQGRHKTQTRPVGLHFELTRPLRAWLKNLPWHEVVEDCPEDEGELIRNFRMLVQLLRDLREIPGISPALQDRLEQLFHQVNRGDVNAEEQLYRSMELPEPPTGIDIAPAPEQNPGGG